MKSTIFPLLAMLFAGCASTDGFGHEEPGPLASETVTDGPEPITSGREIQPNPAAYADASTLALTDCTSGGGARFVWPTARSDAAEVPPGWARSDRQTNDYRVKVAECQRISVGPFERGPVRFVLESHTHVAAPDACMAGSDGILEAVVMHSFWLDDAEMVTHLQTALGLPAIFGEFRYDLASEAFETRTWHWNIPGGDQSELVFYKTDDHEGGNPETVRFFWDNGSAVSFIDLKEDTKQPLYNAPQTHGVLREPMMAAGTEYETYVGVASLIDPGDFDGPIHRFGDLECKEPL